MDGTLLEMKTAKPTHLTFHPMNKQDLHPCLLWLNKTQSEKA
jgi:hypothetical protein